jgi:membrane-associated phospholipid phosphatase
MGNVDRGLAVVLGGLLLLSCGACSQPWKFVRADPPIPGAWTAATPAGAAPQTAGMPPHATPEVFVPQERPRASEASFGSFSRIPGGMAAEGTEDGLAWGPSQDPVLDAAVVVSPDAPSGAPGFRGYLRRYFQPRWHRVSGDYRNYYGWRTQRDLWLGVAAAAVPANTSLDEDFQGWYQRDVRSSGTDDFAAFWKTFGKGEMFIPAYAGLALLGGAFDEGPLIGGVGEFSERVTRGYLVGAPPMVVMQYLLGSSRPGESSVGSQWKPFRDSNAVSGHAFVGAVPFITAAKMCDQPLLKATLYAFSTFTAWSRVNDDAHYLSQACLGWWMAYLACRAVDDTEHEERCFTFTPLVTPEAAGVGIQYRR